MGHPFAWLPSALRWPVLAVLLFGTAALAYRLMVLDKPLAKAVPGGILAFEFAWTQERAQEILGAWSNLGQDAREQLYLDFGFLLFYPLSLSLACAMLAGSPLNTKAAIGVFLAWALLAAGPLDLVENFALLHMLDHGASGPLARLAGWCAGIKFVLVFAGLGYLLLQGLEVLAGKLRAA